MSSTTHRRKILVIDDERIVAETLALVFSRPGFESRVAHSAEEAIDVIALWEPDTAFVDVMLPGTNGVEFARALKDQYPHCNVVLMSGHPKSAELVERARSEWQSLVILPKPLEPIRFLEIARRGNSEMPASSDAAPGKTEDLC